MATKGLAQQWRDMLQNHKDEATKKKPNSSDPNRSLINNYFLMETKGKKEEKENELDILLT